MNTLTRSSSETLLSGIPAYIAGELKKIREDWKRTEASCHREGNTAYNADERMQASLSRALTAKSVDMALQNTGNYRWLDSYLGVAGKGLFIDRDFSAKATTAALDAIEIWRDTVLA